MESNLLCFKRTPTVTALSLPKIYKEGFFTESGVWTKLTIIKGKMKFAFLNLENEIIRQYSLNPKSEVELIEPLSVFKITPNSTDLQFNLEFYCSREDYFYNKYKLNTPHSEFINAIKVISPCKTLDLGAGKGRHSLYLSLLDFDVTAIDYNAEFLHELTDISIKEQLDINVIDHDIANANIKGSYDFIFSTDVFMYLNATRIQSIISNIKQQTHLNGYNLIVSALNATKYGRPLMPLPFTFIEGELKEYYEDWKIISYSENITASPYPYAIILAQKVSE
ncbi:tellurite resistance methyltransferase TehB [Gemella sp. 27098_8_149]|uniref:tellurite resistance methyltransferase TehB n=1 Tax=Gemella sp. 27098_8_149 TaxID=3003689 RepID=UPI00352D6C7E